MYSRQIDGKTLTLSPSGWTYGNTFVLYDRETGTLWYPYAKGLMGIQGTYYKRWLPRHPADDTTWEERTKRHPSSGILR